MTGSWSYHLVVEVSFHMVIIIFISRPNRKTKPDSISPTKLTNLFVTRLRVTGMHSACPRKDERRIERMAGLYSLCKTLQPPVAVLCHPTGSCFWSSVRSHILWGKTRDQCTRSTTDQCSRSHSLLCRRDHRKAQRQPGRTYAADF